MARKARKYSKKASAKVERAMKKKQGGYVEERPLRPQGQEPQTGDRDRIVGSARRGRQGAEKAEDGEEEKKGEAVRTITRCSSCPAMAEQARAISHRHCERSEAIQTVSAAAVWIASSLRFSQ